MILALTGFMGCGKSSVGKRLSSLLSCSWADIDQEIERKTGRPVREIFDREGEEAFRKMEAETLRELIGRRTRIISLGGGTPTIPECRELLREKTVCIWLKASPETLASHMSRSYIRRPLLMDIQKDDPDRWQEEMCRRISGLLEKRESDYAAIARFTVDINGKAMDEIISDIVRLLNSEL